MKKGFTVIELLVASLLLSMLVTMLTMIFNQSSIAWNAGLSSVKALGKERMGLGTYHDIEDDLLPGVAQKNAKTGSSDNRELRYRTVSLWQKGSVNSLRTNQRAFDFAQWGQAGNPLTDISKARNGVSENSNSGGSGSQSVNSGAAGGVIVGVWSAGPDREFGTQDDVNTFPDEIN